MTDNVLDLFQFQPRKDFRDECFSKLKADFPKLGALLVGDYDAEKKCGQKGGTLMVFLENDTLKWTFHHKIVGVTLFGSFPEIVLDVDMVELALSEGRFDRKNGRKS